MAILGHARFTFFLQHLCNEWKLSWPEAPVTLLPWHGVRMSNRYDECGSVSQCFDCAIQSMGCTCDSPVVICRRTNSLGGAGTEIQVTKKSPSKPCVKDTKAHSSTYHPNVIVKCNPKRRTKQRKETWSNWVQIQQKQTPRFFPFMLTVWIIRPQFLHVNNRNKFMQPVSKAWWSWCFQFLRSFFLLVPCPSIELFECVKGGQTD